MNFKYRFIWQKNTNNALRHCWENKAVHYRLFVWFLHLLPIVWLLLKLVVFQNGLCCLLTSSLHHCFDPQVVNIEGSDTDINGRIDSVICGLSYCCPIPSSEVRLGKRSEWEARERGFEGELINMQRKDSKDDMQFCGFHPCKCTIFNSFSIGIQKTIGRQHRIT